LTLRHSFPRYQGTCICYNVFMRWPKFSINIKDFILDILFPPFCLNCQKEGSYLCPDCRSLVDIINVGYCPFCRPPKIVFDNKTCGFCRQSKKLNGLFSATAYQNFIIKRAISQFKYPPYVKKLSKPLSSLIIEYFQSLEQQLNFKDAVLIPVPLAKKKIKLRGFNQSEEIAKELSLFWEIPLVSGSLLKIKETLPQIELSEKERKENVKGAFLCQHPTLIKNRKIFLVDDVFTTGATMEECARVLKNSGAKEVWGITVARE
jgi:competence protein ComFC